MQVEVQVQHTELHPRWRELIDRRAAKLEEVCGEILRLHVTLVHSTHHLRGDEEVRLLANVPQETFKVQKAMADMGDAIHAAFTALEHELHGFTERRRDLHRRAKRQE
jgi:ribosome-associated translation inhibitor RaiA